MHPYSGTPGRIVWAQSRQTKQPSLYAIIGLLSIPTMQYGHRMTRVVSVRVGMRFHSPEGIAPLQIRIDGDVPSLEEPLGDVAPVPVVVTPSSEF